MSAMTNVIRAPSGTYFYRRVVPEKLRPAIGKGEIKISLRTKDPEEAKRRAPDAQKMVDALFAQHRAPAAPSTLSMPGDPPPARLEPEQIQEMVLKWRSEAIRTIPSTLVHS